MLSRLSSARVGVGIPLALPLTAALAIVLAGCGSSGESLTSKSATEILAASRAAALHASSVRIASSVSQGKLSRTSNLELAGNGIRARISFLGVTHEVIRIGNTTYAKGNPAFYKLLAKRTGMHVPQGTWVTAPAGKGIPVKTALSSELTFLLISPGPLTKGPTTTIDGQKVIELKEKAKRFTGSIYIAATGKPYPIEIVKHGQETGQTTFTAWNQPITLTAPTGAIELSKLKRKGR